jgi:hypothetical protein
VVLPALSKPRIRIRASLSDFFIFDNIFSRPGYNTARTGACSDHVLHKQG